MGERPPSVGFRRAWRPPQSNRQLDLFDAAARAPRAARRRRARGSPTRSPASSPSACASRCTTTARRWSRSAAAPGGSTTGVHHMFLEAPARGGRPRSPRSPGRRAARPARRRERGQPDRRVREAQPRAHRRAARATGSQPRGRAHDLQAIFDRLNAEHFGGAIEARIGWGAVRGGRRRRTVKTGVYVQDARIIRIHPTLDRPEVPEFYVATVVFHEMLHQAVPAREVNGRRIVHGAGVPPARARLPGLRAREGVGGAEPLAAPLVARSDRPSGPRVPRERQPMRARRAAARQYPARARAVRHNPARCAARPRARRCSRSAPRLPARRAARTSEPASSRRFELDGVKALGRRRHRAKLATQPRRSSARRRHWLVSARAA